MTGRSGTGNDIQNEFREIALTSCQQRGQINGDKAPFGGMAPEDIPEKQKIKAGRGHLRGVPQVSPRASAGLFLQVRPVQSCIFFLMHVAQGPVSVGEAPGESPQ